MAGGVLTPRQKMINMMYLVLTALLAMNVSKSVLLAFGKVSEGITNSNKVIIEKTKSIDVALTKLAEKNEKAGPLLKKTKEISKISLELGAFLSELKVTLLSDEFSGENEEHPGTPKAMGDIDSPTRLLSDHESKVFKGKILQDKINETRKKFMNIIKDVDGVDATLLASLEASLTLRADDDPKHEEAPEWYHQFHHVPTPGALTLLTKLENDVLSSEATLNEFLLNRVGALDFKFDKLRATVQAEKSYLPGGAPYEANIFLTASSSGITAETFVGSLDWSKFKKDTAQGGSGFLPWNNKGNEEEKPFKSEPKQLGKDGVFKRGTAVGANSYNGAIRIANPAGGYDWYPFKGSYEGAAAGGFSASPTKMNVLYIGVDNPMSITIGDAKPGTERASISGGTITRGSTGWNARVSKQGKLTLTASGTTPDGKPTKSFTAEFRVKRIPDPTPTLGGKLQGGNIKRGTLAAQSGIIALLKDFDFDARFTVVSYDFKLVSNGEIYPERGVRGPSINSKIKNLLKKARSKNIAIFDKIKVKGPDGTSRTLPSLTFTIL